MKVLVIKSSPRKKGNSNTLADEFIRGAQEAGHEVQEFDCARNKVAPCLSCGGCIRTGKCVQKDGFEEFAPMFVEADVLVFVTPVYYFSCTAQIKCLIDRFFSIHFERSKERIRLSLVGVLLTEFASLSFDLLFPLFEDFLIF